MAIQIPRMTMPVAPRTDWAAMIPKNRDNALRSLMLLWKELPDGAKNLVADKVSDLGEWVGTTAEERENARLFDESLSPEAENAELMKSLHETDDERDNRVFGAEDMNAQALRDEEQRQERIRNKPKTIRDDDIARQIDQAEFDMRGYVPMARSR